MLLQYSTVRYSRYRTQYRENDERRPNKCLCKLEDDRFLFAIYICREESRNKTVPIICLAECLLHTTSEKDKRNSGSNAPLPATILLVYWVKPKYGFYYRKNGPSCFHREKNNIYNILWWENVFSRYSPC